MSPLRNRGFTLIEMLLALIIGLVVLTAALSFVATTYRTAGGNEVREEVHRNARFIGMSLERDFQTTGVGITSTSAFGTLGLWNDTIVIIHVPFDAQEATVYPLKPASCPSSPLPAGGTCGANCVNVDKGVGVFGIKAGDMAQINVNGVRRLIVVSNVVDAGSSMALTFTTADSLLHLAAGITGPPATLLTCPSGTFVQKLVPIVYWRDAQKRMMRAEALKLDGNPDGVVVAYGVDSLKSKLVFLDGSEATVVNRNGLLPNQTFDNVVGIRIEAVLAAERADPRLNQGQLYKRRYLWRFAPRNLMWQRNAL
jgi:prepilin-type N-terminal cleavage/methylation domain-containing protein